MHYLNHYYDENTHKTFYKVVKDEFSYTNKWILLGTYLFNDKLKIYQTKESYYSYCRSFIAKKNSGSKLKKFIKFIIDL